MYFLRQDKPHTRLIICYLHQPGAPNRTSLGVAGATHTHTHTHTHDRIDWNGYPPPLHPPPAFKRLIDSSWLAIISVRGGEGGRKGGGADGGKSGNLTNPPSDNSGIFRFRFRSILVLGSGFSVKPLNGDGGWVGGERWVVGGCRCRCSRWTHSLIPSLLIEQVHTSEVGGGGGGGGGGRGRIVGRIVWKLTGDALLFCSSWCSHSWETGAKWRSSSW